MDDTDLHRMAELQGGSQAAWGALYEKYYPALLRFCGNFAAEATSAEEAAQETFLILKEKCASFRPGSPLRPWLYKIARNLCLQNLRKKREVRWSDSVFASRLARLFDSNSSPATRMVNAEMQSKTREVLAALSEEQRTAFLLKYAEGLSRLEIAEVMEVPEATVKSRLYHAMAELRRQLGSSAENL